MPFPSPSIVTPGQWARKYLASAQDVICEQVLRPSHLNDGAAGGRACVAAAVATASTPAGVAAAEADGLAGAAPA